MTSNIQNNNSSLSHDATAARLSAVAASASSLTPIRILRLPEVITRVGLCRASIYLQMEAGVFPKPIPLGARAVGWIDHEIDAWIASQITKR